ncbi:MAG: hypothetical protein M9905_10670 [Rhizobiaceae bacterium]|nr:hypothetical protein [Rhizobiaceae bacterium]
MRVTAFEHYMYADDRRSAPMTFFVRAGFSGRPDPTRMRTAIRHAQMRHPLTRAVISGRRQARTRDLHWIDAPQPEPYIAFATQAEPIDYPGGEPYLDLRREVGLRFFFIETDANRSELWIQVHHAICDGIGITRFLEDVLAEYAAPGSAGAPPDRIELDAAPLERRSEPGLGRRERLARLPIDILRGLRLFRPASPVVSSQGGANRDPAAGGQPFPAHRSLDITPDGVDRLRSLARATDGTLNDLLLRNMFVAIDAHNRASGGSRPIRLSMPTNLRDARLSAMPATNVVGMAFLGRRPAAFEDPDRLLQGVIAETRHIKRYRAGLTLHRAVSAFGAIRGGLVWVCGPAHCHSTAVLSNLGRVFRDSPLAATDGIMRAGDLVLDSYDLLPPIRPLTHLAVGVVEHAGGLRLSAHFNASAITPSEADRILERVAGG